MSNFVLKEQWEEIPFVFYFPKFYFIFMIIVASVCSLNCKFLSSQYSTNVVAEHLRFRA